MGAARRIENDDIMAAELGRLYGARGDLDGCLAGDDRQRVDAGLHAELAQLFLRGGTARIERGEQHLLLRPLRQALADLAGGSGLTGTLQADHHDDDRSRGVQINGDAFGAEHVHQFVMDDLDDHLAGLDAFQNICADSLGTNLVGKRADDIERDVSFEQRTAHFAQGCRKHRHPIARHGL